MHFHLFHPADQGGLRQPLKDIWALNITALVKSYDFAAHVRPSVPLKKLPVTMDMERHRYFAAETYIETLSTSPGYEDKFDITNVNRRTMYFDLVDHGWLGEHDAFLLDRVAYFLKDLSPTAPTDQLIGDTRDNMLYNLENVRLPQHIHQHLLRSLTHSLTTNARVRFFGAAVGPCYL